MNSSPVHLAAFAAQPPRLMQALPQAGGIFALITTSTTSITIEGRVAVRD